VKRFLRVRVESGVPWPTKESRVSFRGHDIVLCPETDQLAPTVLLAFDDSKTSSDQALELVRRFLSSLSWAEGSPIRDMESLEGGQPIWIGKGGARLINPNFRADYLPDPQDTKAALALALYREASTANTVPYKFLGFAKIVNIRYRDRDQIPWINATIGKLRDPGAQARIAELKAAGEDVGTYLYVSGRCAVAHAYTSPVVDPDIPGDLRRLVSDLPVIQRLAEHLIEDELGVKSHGTIWREHLYELAGFRPLLGPIVDRLKRGEQVGLGEIAPLPRLSLRVRDREPLAAFEGLHTEAVDVLDGRLVLRCRSDGGLIQAILVLNFGAERLEFEPEQAVGLVDDGSPGAIQNMIDADTLVRELVVNGQLEVWSVEAGTLLGRTDPYVAVNIDLGRTVEALNAHIAQLQAEKQRRQSSSGPAPASS